MGKFIDLTGQRFGRLTVLYRAENRNKKTYWHCLCDCGNEKDIWASSLHDGNIKSCGCLNSENASKYNNRDKTGQRFGMLVAKERLQNYKNRKTYYLCNCDCGNKAIVLGSNLRLNGKHTTSCGCQSSRNGTKQYDFLRKCRYDDGKKIYKVYKHTTPNGKVYIGITKQSFDRRTQNGKGYSTQRLFWRAIKKYGWNNIKHEIIEDNLTHDEACEREQYYIKIFHSNNPKYGYNISSGGESSNGRGMFVGQYYNDKLVNVFESVSITANIFGVSETTIYNYINNQKNYCGYYFKEIPKEDYVQNTPNEEHIKNFKQYVNKNNKKHLKNKKGNIVKICQYSLEGNYLKTFNSIGEAERETLDTNISTALKKDNHKSKNSLWFYEDEKPTHVEAYRYIHNTQRRIIQLDRQLHIIEKFESINDAIKKTGICRSSIWRCCSKHNKTAGGYIWRYADEVENNTLETVEST